MRIWNRNLGRDGRAHTAELFSIGKGRKGLLGRDTGLLRRPCFPSKKPIFRKLIGLKQIMFEAGGFSLLLHQRGPAHNGRAFDPADKGGSGLAQVGGSCPRTCLRKGIRINISCSYLLSFLALSAARIPRGSTDPVPVGRQ